MCCEGPFGAISQDRRSTRRSAFWSVQSPFCFGLQRLQVLYLWAIWYYIAEPFGNSPTTHFYRRLNFILQSLAHWNIRRDHVHSATRPMVRPRPVLVVRGSPLQPLPKPAQKIWLSLNSQTDPQSVDQTTVCGLCSWIETSLTQPLTQTTVDQHGPSFDPRSVGLTVDEGQQPVS
ncbi:hypothetical protein MTR67_025720 [Solanum verrucosum]|uniref:Late blight resistance protein n=1 Tax=Solanum verrucosum TaxID=315347 RepID=A0AAF0TYX6_SOLVR|nr:hypothetical protein MTR67_025720 [Solanum verrucosum]